MMGKSMLTMQKLKHSDFLSILITNRLKIEFKDGLASISQP